MIALSLRPLLERLAEPSVRQAAWRDAVETCLDHEATAEQCQLRLLQLKELVEHGGQDWGQRSRTLEDMLGDVPGTFARFGEPERQQGPEERDPTGIPVQRRLELCEQVIGEAPRRGDVAVWLVANNAAIAEPWIARGPIQLFNDRGWPKAFRPGGELEQRPEFNPPPELADWDDAQMWFSHLPESEHRVYVRVWLTNVETSRARERARSAFQAMLDLAQPDSLWVLLDGSVAWRSGGGWWGSTFMTPESPAQRRAPAHPIFEGTGEASAEFDPAFLARLLAGESAAVEAVDDATWSVLVERASTAEQRIVLGTRAIERTLSQVKAKENDNWIVAAERYLEAPWVEWRLLNDLFDAGISAMAGLNARRAQISQLRDRAHDLLFPPAEPGRRPFDEAGLAEMRAEILGAIGPGYLEHRILRDNGGTLLDPGAALDHLDRLRARFRRLLRRAERQRNAIVHGTGTAHSAAATVDSFVSGLAALVAQEAMRQAETGRAPVSELERKRTELLERLARLKRGEAWLAIVPEPPFI